MFECHPESVTYAHDNIHLVEVDNESEMKEIDSQSEMFVHQLVSTSLSHDDSQSEVDSQSESMIESQSEMLDCQSESMSFRYDNNCLKEVDKKSESKANQSDIKVGFPDNQSETSILESGVKTSQYICNQSELSDGESKLNVSSSSASSGQQDKNRSEPSGDKSGFRTGKHSIDKLAHTLLGKQQSVTDDNKLEPVKVRTKNFTYKSAESELLHQDYIQYIVAAHEAIQRSGKPNFRGCRIPIKTKMNVSFLETELENYADKEVLEYFKYGWPIGMSHKLSNSRVCSNHKSAVDYPIQIGGYVNTQLSEGSIIGPFKNNPFSSHFFVAPLSSVEKRDSHDRRILSDLSFPPGRSINDRIPKKEYLGETFILRFATVDSLVNLIKEKLRENKQEQILLFKKDLRNAYRQLRIDPGDINAMGILWQNNLYFDLAAVMGLSTSALMCQRTTEAILHVYKNRGYNAAAILDDIASAEFVSQADKAYEKLGWVIHKSGLEEKVSKSQAPSTIMTFMGVQFDTVKLTLQVTQDRLVEILELVRSWLDKKEATRREVESLFGKLNFIAAVVRPGRIFTSRILLFLRGLPRSGSHKVPKDLLKDVAWWEKFLPIYNGISMMSVEEWSEPDSIFASDACLVGCGAWYAEKQLFFHTEFPKFIKQLKLHINALEMLTIVVSAKLWGKFWSGRKILVKCDNESTVIIINTGRSRDPFLQACLRELILMAGRHSFEIRACHIPGVSNRIPDELSRWSLSKEHENRFWSLVPSTAREVFVYEGLFEFCHIW